MARDHFDAISNQFYNLRILWAVYTSLFGTNKERVDLLNDVSGSTAYWIERCMYESVVLGICRLTDPVSSARGRSSNISVSRLPLLVPEKIDRELIARVEAAKEASNFARDWRNKKIAHSDEAVQLGKAQLANSSRLAINDAIEKIAACLRRYSIVHHDTTLVTHPIRALGRDEVEFLIALHLGFSEREKYKIAQRQSFLDGKSQEFSPNGSLPDWLTFRPADIHDVEE